MSKKNKHKKRKKEKTQSRPKLELKSDKRTAEFLVRRLEEIQDELADLLPDFRSMSRFHEVFYLGWILSGLQSLTKKCRKFADNGLWEEC